MLAIIDYGEWRRDEGEAANGLRFMRLINKDKEEWYDFFSKPENQSKFYLNVADTPHPNTIRKAVSDWRFAQAATEDGIKILGVDGLWGYPETKREGEAHSKEKDIRGRVLEMRDGKLTGELLPQEFDRVITKGQIKLWFMRRGHSPEKEVAALIGKIADKDLRLRAQVEWEEGATFYSVSPIVKEFIAAMGWPQAAVEKKWLEIESGD